ncbi:MAG: VanZ family protein [Bacteroidales bacterium]|nr:VanZ family protein [Bacteroidales bacterium]
MGKTTTKTILSRVLFLLYVCAVCLICFADSSSLPRMQRFIFGLPTDKVVHFIMFAPFPILSYLSFDHPSGKPGRSVLFVFLSLIAGAALAYSTEVIQSYLPSRSMDIKDFYADALALGVSSIFILLVDLTRK